MVTSATEVLEAGDAAVVAASLPGEAPASDVDVPAIVVSAMIEEPDDPPVADADVVPAPSETADVVPVIANVVPDTSVTFEALVSKALEDDPAVVEVSLATEAPDCDVDSGPAEERLVTASVVAFSDTPVGDVDVSTPGDALVAV